MVFGLTDTEKNHENVKKIYEFQIKNEELSNKLLNQYQVNKELEGELEKYKSQSFIGGGKITNSVNKPFPMLDASSILH